METETIRMDLEYVTKRRELPPGESLGAVLQRLDGHARRQGQDGRLAHFLQKRSYVKALAWLDDPNLPHQP